MPVPGKAGKPQNKKKMWISATISKPNSSYVQCASMESLNAFTKYNNHPDKYEEITIIDLGMFSSAEIIEALISHGINAEIIYFRNNQTNTEAIRIIKEKMSATKIKSQAFGKKII